MRINTVKGLIKVLCVIALALLLCAAAIWFFLYSQNGSGHFFAMNVLLGKNGLNETNSETIDSGQTKEYSFISYDAFSDLDLYIDSGSGSEIKTTLFNESWESIADSEVPVEPGTDRFIRVFSDLAVPDSRSVFILRVENTGSEAVKVASRNGGTAVRSDKGVPFVLIGYIFIHFFVYLCLAGCVYTLLYKGFRLNKVFLSVALPVVIVFSTLLYPGTACDENYHYIAAYQLSNRIMGIEGDVIRSEDEWIVNSRWAVPNLEGVYFAVSQSGHRTSQTDLITNTHRGHSGASVVYLMPALGITAARLVKLNAFSTYYLARAMNIALFLAVGYLALSIAKFGEGILFCFLLLPLTINQCISVNQDCFCYIMSFLAIAYWTRIRVRVGTEKKKLSLIEVITIALLFFVLLSCKAYVIIMGIYLIVPWAEAYAVSPKKIFIAIGGLTAVVASIILFGIISGNSSYVGQFISYIFSDGDSNTYSFMDLVKNPIEIVSLIGITSWDYGFAWFCDAFGSRLSWETYLSPGYAVAFFLMVLAIALADKRGEALKWKGKGMILLIEVALYIVVILRALSWTVIGRSRLYGVQGRYFIPAIPLIFFAVINRDRFGLLKKTEKTVVLVFVLLIAVLCMDLLNNHILKLLIM